MSEFDSPEYDIPKKKNNWSKPLINILVGALLCGGCSYGAVEYALSKTRNTVIMYEGKDSAPYDYSTGDITEVVADIADSVVEVYTEVTTYSQFFGSYITEGAGSGVIVSKDGYIVTNYHVIDGASSVTVKLNTAEQYPAEIMASDEVSDIAILKIESEDLHAVTMGNSDNLKVGQRCIAIGNPLGTLGGTVSDGIISALSRTITIENQEMTVLQTNTAINPGNSGGGLFDLNGNLIGIVNAKSSGSEIEGIGFAIPINDAQRVIEDLITKGYVSGRAAIGISCTSIDTIQKAWNYGFSCFGVYVNEVTSKEAQKAGLQQKDLIVAMDEKVVQSLGELQAILNKHKAGDQVTIKVLRNGNEVEISLILAEREN